jgi:hypothetical protein
MKRHPERIDSGLQGESPDQLRWVVCAKVSEEVASVFAQNTVYPT